MTPNLLDERELEKKECLQYFSTSPKKCTWYSTKTEVVFHINIRADALWPFDKVACSIEYRKNDFKDSFKSHISRKPNNFG